jgi:trimethylamine--corrinoid protein Co-methyltransferase
MGLGAAVLDMATSQCCYNAPEFLMAYLASVEMSHHFDIPNWGYAGTSDSQIPDGQAVYEAGLLTYLSAASGSNLNHDIGYLDFARAGSLDMVVMMDEVIDQVRRIQKGIEIDDEQLAVEVIGRGAHQGHFLTQPHTLRHLRSTQWRPDLFCRDSHERWVEEGRTTLLDRAHDRLNHLLATHRPPPVPADILAALNRLKVSG